MDDLFLREISLKTHDPNVLGYAAKIPAVQRLSRLPLQSQATFFIGENGSGKSTLLEAVAVAAGFNPEGGSINFSFSTADTHAPLWQAIKLVRGIRRPRTGFFLRAESFYNVASYIDELDKIPGKAPLIKSSYGGKSLHSQSHGESFMALCLNRFSAGGLYILDEPEAALSPQNQLALLCRIHSLAQMGSQFLIATHSPLLMALPDADIYTVNENGLELTPYEQTGHYQLTRSFLENPKRMLSYLLEGD